MDATGCLSIYLSIYLAYTITYLLMYLSIYPQDITYELCVPYFVSCQLHHRKLLEYHSETHILISFINLERHALVIFIHRKIAYKS